MFVWPIGLPHWIIDRLRTGHSAYTETWYTDVRIDQMNPQSCLKGQSPPESQFTCRVVKDRTTQGSYVTYGLVSCHN